MNPLIESFLAEGTVAVVGVSRGRGFGGAAMAALRRAGYVVFPVNEAADEVSGEKCYRSLAAIPAKVGAVVVVVPPSRSAGVVEDCARLGIRKVWLQQGAESADALRAAERAGVQCVERECVLMYARPRGIHRLHRWWRERHAAPGPGAAAGAP